MFLSTASLGLSNRKRDESLWFTLFKSSFCQVEYLKKFTIKFSDDCTVFLDC